MVAVMAGIVASGIYESFDEWSYLYVGLILCVPIIVLPLLFPGQDRVIPWHQRYVTKANAWIFIQSFIGNYFWTHYFFQVLGCAYWFPSHRLNNVPLACYLITHAYFHLYHEGASLLQRRLWRAFNNKVTVSSVLAVGLLIVFLNYSTALAEVVTIQNFPYYTYKDKWAMWVVGSGFYGLYFLISFPVFFSIDETRRWSMKETVVAVLAYCMVTTVMLDLWRLVVGPIYADSDAGTANGDKVEVPFIF